MNGKGFSAKTAENGQLGFARRKVPKMAWAVQQLTSNSPELGNKSQESGVSSFDDSSSGMSSRANSMSSGSSGVASPGRIHGSPPPQSIGSSTLTSPSPSRLTSPHIGQEKKLIDPMGKLRSFSLAAPPTADHTTKGRSFSVASADKNWSKIKYFVADKFPNKHHKGKMLNLMLDVDEANLLVSE